MFAGSLGLQRPVRPLRVGDEGLLQTRWGLTVLSVLSSVSRAGALKSNHATQWDLTPRRRPAEERPGGLPGAPAQSFAGPGAPRAACPPTALSPPHLLLRAFLQIAS